MIEPGSPEWLSIITPSKVPSILGISRWKSQYTLWHEMAGIIEPAPISEARQDDFDYGHACELAAREYWKFKNPDWRISRGEVQISNPDLPFPNLATIDLRGSRGSLRRVVEVKTARDLGEFGDDGSGEIPRDYAAQILMQMLITGWHETADLVCWAQYGKPRIYHVEYDAGIAEAIIGLCAEFVESLATENKPELDNTISTYETVRAMHPDIDKGTEIQLPPAEAYELLASDGTLKNVEKQLRGRKTALLDQMGSAQYAMVGDLKIADRRPHAKGSVALVLAGKNIQQLSDQIDAQKGIPA
ncbi:MULTISPECIES: YqaJ viral recombinase family protein [Mycobacteriaceae]|uniref:YqaJ viral recombinase family protein n=1 Tax=Mycobacteriaceae TaxID=1762 RepID=UPI0009922D96|nr:MULTISPECIES: YqaJ viral recombinase family protein [Mycobacteriaceae]MDO3058505.1 YqaJ viral recombinase family protein [Mycobacteroides abscessus subsp. abscessus]MDO3277959.1 YqaJ viral recombinase family protein [Mycobacteroides abscessus subsp. abscessus]